jgi:hypothetical protein
VTPPAGSRTFQAARDTVAKIAKERKGALGRRTAKPRCDAGVALAAAGAGRSSIGGRSGGGTSSGSGSSGGSSIGGAPGSSGSSAGGRPGTGFGGCVWLMPLEITTAAPVLNSAGIARRRNGACLCRDGPSGLRLLRATASRRPARGHCLALGHCPC